MGDTNLRWQTIEIVRQKTGNPLTVDPAAAAAGASMGCWFNVRRALGPDNQTTIFGHERLTEREGRVRAIKGAYKKMLLD